MVRLSSPHRLLKDILFLHKLFKLLIVRSPEDMDETCAAVPVTLIFYTKTNEFWTSNASHEIEEC